MKDHEYIVDADRPTAKRPVYMLLATIAVVLVLLAREIAVELLQNGDGGQGETTLRLAFFVGSIAPLTVFSLLVQLFENYLWKTIVGSGICRLVGVQLPTNISGRFEGTARWIAGNDTSDKKEREVVVAIKQTWSRLLVRLDYVKKDDLTKSWSFSDLAILTTDRERVAIKYTYTFQSYSDDSSLVRGGGIQELEFEKAGSKWKAKGHYYTENRGRGALELRQLAP